MPRFATVRQLREALAALQEDDQIVTNGIGNLSVVKDDPGRSCDCGRPHYTTRGYIELGPFDVSWGEPSADLTLMDKA